MTFINVTSIDTVEKPIVILKPKRSLCIIGIFISVLLVPFFLFGVILPVIQTGDFASVWPVTDKRVGFKTILFLMGWLYLLLLPLTVTAFKVGDCYFYEDRMEVIPFLGWNKVIYFYKGMFVNIHINVRLVIFDRMLPPWTHPIQRYKAQYWDGFALGIIPTGLNNPEDVQKVLQILLKKASSCKYEKSLF